jgi:hypothetical protein
MSTLQIEPGSQRGTNHLRAQALLQAWLAEDVANPGESIEKLKLELDQHRESTRKLFP